MDIPTVEVKLSSVVLTSVYYVNRKDKLRQYDMQVHFRIYVCGNINANNVMD